VAEQLDGLAIEGDISSEADATSMAEQTLARYGKIDVLVNAAAIVPFVPWDEVDFAYWRKIISVNLDGAYLISRAVEAPMREAGYGRIVHIASNAFMAGTPNMGPYLAAKGGVVGLTRALATELGRYGITANAVAPGITRTEGCLATPHRDAFDFVQALQAIPRHGLPADIAPAAAFLASEESGWITGQVLVADAGHIRN
jgi:3-oxoacyl-[acyl-carrier protein] reductase/pyridoxal 4-dehydrogenase